MTWHWQFQPIFGSYLVVATLIGATALLLLVAPSFGQLTKPRRRWLMVLRSALAVLLLIAMLRPTHIRTEKQAQTAQLLVLFDTSRSMDHRDGDGGKTRWDEQLSLLRSAMPQLGDMGDRFSVELIGFAAGIQPQEKRDGKFVVTARPSGEETDIGRAIEEALQRHVGKRMAAVILVSDGAQRAIAPKTPPQQAARQLDRRATPLYTIALGRSRDQSQSRDVSIENLQDEYSVFVKNEFALRVGVRIQGYVNQPIPVTLVMEDEAGTATTIGPLELVATQDSQVVMGDFSYRPEKPGQYKMRVRAAEQVGEMIDNNEMTAFLNVREGGLRVLLLTGALTPEPKFIRQSLDESQDIELDDQFIPAWSRPDWPIDLQSRVTLDEYDVFVIGDLDAKALHTDNWDRIAQLVESGRGLMMYGGYHSFGPGGYFENALADVLPIEMNRLERELDPILATRKERHLDGDIEMIPIGNSPVTHIASDDLNLDAWRSLKPLKGANKFDKLKDDAVVLAKSANDEPLLVRSTYLGGRVLAFAGDSTYRWWRYGRQDAHKKFWRQSILWLARRDHQQANSVFIQLPQRRFQARSRITFETGLTDEAGDTVIGADLRATLALPDGTTEIISLTDNRNGTQGVVTNTNEAGDFRLTVEALDGTAVITSSYKDFVVQKTDFELADPAANPGLLDMLARMTTRVGGKAIAPEQLSGLLKEIKAAPPEDEIQTQSKWQLGDTTLDAWSYFLLLVGLLTAEWFLRKKWGLV